MLRNTLALTFAAAILAADSAQANLLYQFDWGTNGTTGTTIADLSGFGTADNGILYDSTTPKDNYIDSTALTVSPNGGAYGNFATDDRRNIPGFGTKWNDGTTGVVATDAVTITMLLRDVNLSGGTTVDGAFFRTDNGGSSLLSLEPDSTGTTTPTLQLNVNGSSDSTSVAVDLSNSSTGNGWILLAFTYSSASNVGKVYLGRDFNSGTGTWGSFGQVGTDLSIASSGIPAGDLGAATRFGFGSSSGSSQQFNGDDFRIYNEVLDASTIGNLYIPEPTSLALLGLGGLCLLGGRRRQA